MAHDFTNFEEEQKLEILANYLWKFLLWTIEHAARIIAAIGILLMAIKNYLREVLFFFAAAARFFVAAAFAFLALAAFVAGFFAAFLVVFLGAALFFGVAFFLVAAFFFGAAFFCSL